MKHFYVDAMYILQFCSRSLLLACLALSIATQLCADEEETRQEVFPTPYIPWFTGPLIAPSAYTVKPGHYSLEPYLYFFVFNGFYDGRWKVHKEPNFYSTRVQLQARIGLSKSVDCRIFPEIVYNATEGRHYANIGDLPAGLGVQLVRAQVTDPYPAVKLSLRATIPLGKYQHLHPNRKATDAIGSGSWEPIVGLVFSKLFHTAPKHYLSTRLFLNYQFAVPIYVKGFNAYGGAADTRGTVHHGGIFTGNGAIQYNFDRHWVFACDLLYVHSDKNGFSGKTGTHADGAPAINTHPSSEQWSFAPAVEYNWSRNLGIIGGVWFTFAGRNCQRFVSSVIAVNIYI